MNASSDNTSMELTSEYGDAPFFITNGTLPEGMEDLYCGEMDDNYMETWTSCQYWCEGVLFAVVGAIGLIGNIISIFVLVTK